MAGAAGAAAVEDLLHSAVGDRSLHIDRALLLGARRGEESERGDQQPEVALRVGVYGAFIPVPWEDVFEGGRGEFRDAHFDPVTREADDALLH